MAGSSLIITTFNRERYLSAAIESILMQTRQDFELLVWDDGSTDSSPEIARSYAKRDRRVRVVAAKHRGRILALKAAVAQTTGAYLGFVDDDDLLAPTALQETVAVLEQEPQVGLVYTDYADIDAQGKLIGYGQRCRIPYSKQRLLIDFMTFHFRLVRRSVFEQVGGFDEAAELAEDYDLCLRLSEVTQVQRVRKPLYFYRHHSQSLSHQKQVGQTLGSRDAIARAIKRRGLADRFQIEVVQGRFFLKQKSLFISTSKKFALPMVALPLIAAMGITPVRAQNVVPAADGTGTAVAPDGDRIDIGGGKLSGDGANLFHSFEKFGLNQNEIANFLSNPAIQNILSRVVGGDPSVINGLLQVSGGNSNLYLLNPAGIIFGANARLNVPGDFVATTSNGIGFGSNWFNAIGENNYANLIGNPDTFAFTMGQPGVIVNAGDLKVSEGQSLSLTGGTVVNTGTLSAQGGQITVAAIPGTNMVRISQPGHLLSLDIPITPSSSQPNQWTLPVASLPQLLTGSEGQNLGLRINANGQAELESGISVQSGDVVAKNVNAQTATLSADRNLTLVESQLNTTGDLNLLAKDTIQVRDSVSNPFSAQAGRNLYIQGDRGVDILALNHSQIPFQSGGNLSLVSGGNISGDAHFASGGNFSILNLAGQLGNFVSLYDPVFRVNGDVTFGNYTGASLKIESTGSIFGGNITITTPEVASGGGVEFAFVNIPADDPDLATLTTTRALILRAGLASVTPFTPTGGGYGLPEPIEPTPSLSPGSIQVTSINTAGLEDGESTGVTGPVILEARGDIRTTGSFTGPDGSILSIGAYAPTDQGSGNGGNISLTSTEGSIDTSSGDVLTAGSAGGTGGNITFNAPTGTITTAGVRSSGTPINDVLNVTTNVILTAGGNITTSNVTTNGQNITLTTSGGNINTTAGIVNTISSFGNGGNINLTATNGSISTGDLSSDAFSFSGNAGNGGAIALNASGNISTGQISATSTVGSGYGGNAGNGGQIALTSTTGNISTGDISAESSATSGNAGNGGAIALSANGSINTFDLRSLTSTVSGNASNGGAIALDASSITTGAIDASRLIAGASIIGGGNIFLTGDEINFTGGPNSTLSTGTITLQPRTPSLNITLGGGDATAALDLTVAELATLQDGFSSITIGRADSQGQINLVGNLAEADNSAFKDPVTLRSPNPGGSINTTNYNLVGTGDASIALNASSDINTGNVTTAGRDITITSTNGSINTATGTLNTSTAAGDGGNISLSATNGVISIGDFNSSSSFAGTAGGGYGSSIPAGNGGNISLTGNTRLNNTSNNLNSSSTSGSGGNIAFNNAVDGTTAGINSLILNAGSGNITFTGTVGSTTSLGNLVANSTGTTVFNSTINAASISTDVGGTTQLNGSVTTSGNQTYNDAVTLGTNATTLQGNNIRFANTLTLGTPTTRLTGTNIAFDNAVNGTTANQQSLQVNGNTTFGGVVGSATVPLNQLNINGTTALNGGTVTTAGNQTYNGAVTLDNNTTLTGNNIRFGSTINSATTTPRTLSVNTLNNGVTTFDGAVGNNVPLLSLSTNQDGTTQLNSGFVTTTGDQIYNDAVTLGSDTILAGNNIAFNSTVNSDALPRSLTVNTTSNGVTTFNGVVGSTAPLANLTTNLDGQTRIAANITTVGSNMTFNDPVILSNNVVLTNTGTTGISFNTVNSDEAARSLSADANNGIISYSSIDTNGGNIDLSATAISSNAATNGLLDTSTNGNAGNVNLTSSQGDIEVGAINASSTSGQGGNVTINSNRLFRAISTIPGTNDSISALGNQGGSVEINQAGGLRETPRKAFVVGDPSIAVAPREDKNGTVGNIVTTQNGQRNAFGDNSFSESITQGNLRIITDDVPDEDITEVDKNINSIQELPRQIGRLPSPDLILAAASSSTTQAEFAQCRQFEEYFGRELGQFGGEKGSCGKTQTAEDIQNLLRTIATQTGKKSAIVYLTPEEQGLKIIAHFPEGAPLNLPIQPAANRAALLKVAREFRTQVAPFETDPITSEVRFNVGKLKTNSYLASGQQLYKWMIAPIEAELKARGINTLVLSVGSGLRSLPLAALHDGKQFLVEKYSIGLIPSLNLTDTRYQPIQKSQILAMGASQFSDLEPLPAVPVEVKAIVQEPWKGQSFLNQDFTLAQLKIQRQKQTYGIVHLATHGKFQPGDPSNSFIQVGNQRLGLDQLRQLQLDLPTVQLLTLSACETALGDEEAELGFAGLAVAAGVKTSMASLWEVSDVGTLSMMTEFYRQLSKAPIKADALQQVQIAMIKGQIRLDGNKLIGPTGQLNLPPDTAALLNQQIAEYKGIKDLSHPYFWSAFTMIGNPW